MNSQKSHYGAILQKRIYKKSNLAKTEVIEQEILSD